LWRIRTGAPWRDLPEKYGRWTTIYQRFRRWSEAGIWEGPAKARPGLDWAAFQFTPPSEIQLY
jgi:transposase